MSSNWSTRGWVVTSIAALGTLAGLKLMFEYKNYKNVSKRKQTKHYKRKSEVTVIQRSLSRGLPSDEELLKASFTSVQQMQQNESDLNRGNKQLLRWLRILSDEDMKLYQAKTRLLAAQYLDMHYVRRSTRARSPEAYRAIVEGQKADLEIAWRLLQCQPDMESERVAVRLLALKLVTRLKDKSRMLPLFHAIMRRISTNEGVTQEALSAFISAPILGRWEETRVLGKHCISHGIRLNDLHKVAQDTPDIPDLQILYQLAEERVRGLTDRNVKEQNIRWSEYLIKALRIKVRSSEEGKQPGDSDFHSQIESWKVIDIPSETKILRYGAIAQMLSFSLNPIPMVGPATDARILVKGQATTSRGQRTEQIYIESQGPGNNGMWRGEYTCIRDDSAQSNLRVDIEMTLEEARFWELRGRRHQILSGEMEYANQVIQTIRLLTTRGIFFLVKMSRHKAKASATPADAFEWVTAHIRREDSK